MGKLTFLLLLCSTMAVGQQGDTYGKFTSNGSNINGDAHHKGYERQFNITQLQVSSLASGVTIQFDINTVVAAAFKAASLSNTKLSNGKFTLHGTIEGKKVTEIFLEQISITTCTDKPSGKTTIKAKADRTGWAYFLPTGSGAKNGWDAITRKSWTSF